MPKVVAVCRSSRHAFSKVCEPQVLLRAGLGVDGDAHAGRTVRHRSRVKLDPTQPNLRQVHLIASELFEELEAAGFRVQPGDLGENITTGGLDVLGLSRGTRLHIGTSAILEVTGLRNPCVQIDDFQSGLLRAVLGRNADGDLVRKAGIMAIVLADGVVRPDDLIAVDPPDAPFEPLAIV